MFARRFLAPAVARCTWRRSASRSRSVRVSLEAKNRPADPRQDPSSLQRRRCRGGWEGAPVEEHARGRRPGDEPARGSRGPRPGRPCPGRPPSGRSPPGRLDRSLICLHRITARSSHLPIGPPANRRGVDSMPSHRSLRVAEAIREVVSSAILFDVSDPRVAGHHRPADRRLGRPAQRHGLRLGDGFGGRADTRPCAGFRAPRASCKPRSRPGCKPGPHRT